MTTVDGLRVAQFLAGRVNGRVEVGHPLAMLTTYRLGGPAAVYVEPTDSADVLEFARALMDLRENGLGVPVLSIGRGSNLVVSDHGWDGVALRLGSDGFSWISAIPDNSEALSAGGGT